MKRERIKAGCYSVKQKPNTFELAVLHRKSGDGKIKIMGEKKDSDGNALENQMEIRQGRRQQGRREVTGRQEKIRTGLRNAFLGTETKQWKFFILLGERGRYCQTRIMDLACIV